MEAAQTMAEVPSNEEITLSEGSTTSESTHGLSDLFEVVEPTQVDAESQRILNPVDNDASFEDCIEEEVLQEARVPASGKSPSIE